MIVVATYRGFRIEVNAAAVDGRHNAEVRILRHFARDKPPDHPIFVPRPGDPDAPSLQSAVIFEKARKPIDLDRSDSDGFIYDHQEDSFIDSEGNTVTPIQILNRFYTTHCETLRLGFRIRWAIGSAIRRAIRAVVWKGQDAAMWVLLNFYDVEVVDDRKENTTISFISTSAATSVALQKSPASARTSLVFKRRRRAFSLI